MFTVTYKACYVLDRADMITDPVDRQIARAKHIFLSEDQQALRQTRNEDFFIKKLEGLVIPAIVIFSIL